MPFVAADAVIIVHDVIARFYVREKSVGVFYPAVFFRRAAFCNDKRRGYDEELLPGEIHTQRERIPDEGNISRCVVFVRLYGYCFEKGNKFCFLFFVPVGHDHFIAALGVFARLFKNRLMFPENLQGPRRRR